MLFKTSLLNVAELLVELNRSPTDSGIQIDLVNSFFLGKLLGFRHQRLSHSLPPIVVADQKFADIHHSGHIVSGQFADEFSAFLGGEPELNFFPKIPVDLVAVVLRMHQPPLPFLKLLQGLGFCFEFNDLHWEDYATPKVKEGIESLLYCDIEAKRSVDSFQSNGSPQDTGYYIISARKFLTKAPLPNHDNPPLEDPDADALK